MGIFEQFPYTNFHNLNLDKILKRTAEAEEAVRASEAAALQAAADAAASAAGIAAAESKADTALNTANTAATTAANALTYSQAKATHSFEILIDDQNSTITVTDCTTGEVITPLTAWQLVNAMFGLNLTAADLIQFSDVTKLAYPNAAEWPNIKIVNAYQPIYVAEAVVAFNPRGYLSMTWLAPGNSPTLKTLICSMNMGFTYQFCTIV